MFAADLQPSWPSKYKTKAESPFIILLFETLQFRFLYTFCGINQFLAIEPMDLKKQVRTRKTFSG